MNSLQSAGEGSVDPSRSGDPPGLRLGLEDGVRGSLYKDLKKGKDDIIFFFLEFAPPLIGTIKIGFYKIGLFGFPLQERLEFILSM